jgi:hypothetical protein
LSLSRSITACLYSLTPFDTSLIVIPIPQPSIDTIPTLLITLQVPLR